MKKFALIGAAGYIAPRHMRAIKETNNELIAALDKCDSVGIIDSYFPNADFFTEYERFDRHIDKLKRIGKKIDYVSICSPNYLHDSHIRFALRQGAEAICEKPIVLNPWNIDALSQIEAETNKKINTILQLRLHPSIIKLKKQVEASKKQIFDIDLTYITSRGKWYYISWKGDNTKSGGIATNIGVHFFDMLTWIFGKVKKNIVHLAEPNKSGGFLELERANVRWFMSLDKTDLPKIAVEKAMPTFRSITIENEELEFSTGFTDLHNESYKKIIAGDGFSLEDTRESIQTVYDIRNSKPLGLKGDYHPFIKNISKK